MLKVSLRIFCSNTLLLKELTSQIIDYTRRSLILSHIYLPYTLVSVIL
jgi:hypothetical protein